MTVKVYNVRLKSLLLYVDFLFLIIETLRRDGPRSGRTEVSCERCVRSENGRTARGRRTNRARPVEEPRAWSDAGNATRRDGTNGTKKSRARGRATRESPEGKRWVRASDLSHGAATTEPLEPPLQPPPLVVSVLPSLPSCPAPDTPTQPVWPFSLSNHLYSFSISPFSLPVPRRLLSLRYLLSSPSPPLRLHLDRDHLALCSFSFTCIAYLRRLSLLVLGYACMRVYTSLSDTFSDVYFAIGHA